MQILKLIPRNFIQLFGEGGGAGGGTGAGDAGGAPAGAEQAAVAQPQQGVKNPLADVKYGKQDDAADAGSQKAGEPADDRNAQFEALIKGEYKDLYDQRMQDTIQKRLKGTAETVNRYNELTPVLEMLGQKYGVDASDAKALSKAIEEDSSFYDDSFEKTLILGKIEARGEGDDRGRDGWIASLTQWI